LSGNRREGSENALASQMRELQTRLEETVGPVSPTASRLYADLGAVLRRAVSSEVLRNGAHDVSKLLRMSEGKVVDGGIVYELIGGPDEIDFIRLTEGISERERFVRDDGAVIHFRLIILETSQTIELLTYGYEIYFPTRTPLAFVRFDLNRRGHENDDRGLRAHLHPGHEDVQLPCPMLAPVEALNFLLYRCRTLRDVTRT
jgi:hypothetical protein